MSGATAPARDNVRRAALKILGRMNIPAGGGPSDGYSNILVDSFLKNNPDLADADRALLSALVSGVCERIITLDYVIDALSSRPPEKLDHDVLNLLRIGLWQLGYTDRIPPHAAVNETVSLTKKSATGFVNAILRSFIRKKDGIKLPEGASAGALSVRYSVNAELCERFIKEFGAERTESVLAAFFERRGTDLRVNTLKTDVKELSRELEAEGFSFDVPPGGKTIRNLRGRGLPAAVREGRAFVQDYAAHLATEALGARAGMRVLDVCACPGAKSFGAALDMRNGGEVVCCDLHGSKLPLIRSGASRLGIGIIRTVCRDSSVPEPDFAGSFDRVICDVPCSGYGVIGKKPEIRYREPRSSQDLPELQLSILNAAATALKPEGIIVYSTCTLLPEENENVVSRFLSDHPDFVLIPFSAGGREAPDGMLTLMPDEGTDGFFTARMMKAIPHNSTHVS